MLDWFEIVAMDIKMHRDASFLLTSTLKIPIFLAFLSKAPYSVSKSVKTWEGSLALDHAVKPVLVKKHE